MIKEPPVGGKTDFFRFSPIKTKEELMEAIKYTHFSCLELCQKVFGRYLPVSGNLGIFCHFDEEYVFLTKLREEMTDKNINWNNKYYLLHKPITINAKGDMPETTYTYLYIRRPDEEKPQVGDVDLVLGGNEFQKLKKIASEKTVKNGVELFYRPDLDMVRLSKAGVDVLPYITTKYISDEIDILK